MKGSRLALVALLILLPAGSGFFFLRQVSVLQIENTGRPGTLLIRIRPGEIFTVNSIHSIYLEPVAEEFTAGEGEDFVLLGVRTPSPAVAAYYGFEEGKGYYPVNRKMKSFFMRLGVSHPQTLGLGGRVLSLAALGEPGDRVEVRVRRMRRGQVLLSSGKKERG